MSEGNEGTKRSQTGLLPGWLNFFPFFLSTTTPGERSDLSMANAVQCRGGAKWRNVNGAGAWFVPEEREVHCPVAVQRSTFDCRGETSHPTFIEHTIVRRIRLVGDGRLCVGEERDGGVGWRSSFPPVGCDGPGSQRSQRRGEIADDRTEIPWSKSPPPATRGALLLASERASRATLNRAHK